MRLERLVVGGFGRLVSGLELDFAPGFNLVLAPNEGGKTTLSQFITAMFYGFGRRQGGSHRFQPWSGGQVGGELTYRLDSDQVFTISRHLVRRGEKLSLRDGGGQEVELGKRQPGELHLGLSRGAFLTVSRVELDDLQGAFSGRGKDGSQARQELKGFFFQEAATRGELANPVEVRESWQEEAAGLYSRDRRRGRADQGLVQELEQADKELAQARAEQEKARGVMEELRSLEAQAREAEAALARAVRALEQAQAARQRGELLQRRAQLQGEMAQLTAQGLADEATQLRARDLEQEAVRLQGEAKKARARAGRQKEQVAAPLDEEALATLDRRLVGLRARQGELERRGKELAAQEDRLRQRWGLEPAELVRLDQDLPTRLEAARQALARAREQAEARRQELEARGARPAELAWAWPLGLAGMGLGVLLLLAWWVGAPLAWAPQAGVAAVLAGLGLAVWGRLCRRRQEDWQEAHQGLAAARELVEAARRELDTLTATLGPEPARAPAPELAAALARARDLAAAREALARDEQDLTADLEEVLQELKTLGSRPGEEPEAALARLGREAAAAARVGEEVRRLEDQAREKEAQAQERRQELERLLADSGLADLAALAQAAQRSRQVRELAAQLAEVDQQLGGAPGPGESVDVQALARAEEQAGKDLEESQTHLRRLEAQRGQLQERLEQLKKRPQPAQLQARRDQIEQRRRDLARRHTVLLLAGALLQRAMDQFRLQAQPQLLVRAARYLEQASAGAYKWLGSDLFRPDMRKEPRISARRDQGRAEREAEDLSRGTRDQLYLCLRLALADEITQRGQAIPLILDDPLVNMDDTRLRASLEMLAALAPERQVLLMTCHQEQARLLERITRCQTLELA